MRETQKKQLRVSVSKVFDFRDGDTEEVIIDKLFSDDFLETK